MMMSLRNVSSKIQILAEYQKRVDRLTRLSSDLDRIAHFGCSSGSETLALSVILKAQEVIGIDKSGVAIRQAREELNRLQEDLGMVRRDLRYAPDLPADVRLQLEAFAREYSGRIFVEYVEGDMTETTPLPSDHFDVAFCDYTLYFVACEDSSNLLSAVSELARVIKPTGIVVANEPKTCLDGTPLDFTSVFEQIGLLPVEIDGELGLVENEAFYAYKRA